jgi:hypothetical protein
MKLYDFSIYAQRRKERQAAEAVASTVASINTPGAVIELKVRVNDWFTLHREVLRRASS